MFPLHVHAVPLSAMFYPWASRTGRRNGSNRRNGPGRSYGKHRGYRSDRSGGKRRGNRTYRADRIDGSNRPPRRTGTRFQRTERIRRPV